MAEELRMWPMSGIDWILEVGTETEKVANRAALSERLAQLRTNREWNVRLAQRGEKLAGWQGTLYRLLGLSTAMDGPSVFVRVAEDQAAVSLLDGDFNETIVMGPQPSQEPAGAVVFALGDGTTEQRPRAECIGADEAVSFLLHFFERGTRPRGFRYKKAGQRSD